MDTATVIARDGHVRATREALRIKIYADGVDPAEVVRLAENPAIAGFVTNPTLMYKAGITDYERFARELIAAVPHAPISFAVFADDDVGMLRQARKLASFGDNVFVKIPVTNTKRESTGSVVRELTASGVKLNVTAVMTAAQVGLVCESLAGGAAAYISVFAGRIADTGRDPLPIMRDALALMKEHENVRLIWASPRELLNVFQADSIGTHIIAVTSELLAKLALIDKDLTEYSAETVAMFANDAAKAGFVL